MGNFCEQSFLYESESENALFGLDINLHNKFNISRRREKKKLTIFKIKAHTKTILCRYRVAPGKKIRKSKEVIKKEEKKKKEKNQTL